MVGVMSVATDAVGFLGLAMAIAEPAAHGTIPMLAGDR
jgi:hypothetical protein